MFQFYLGLEKIRMFKVIPFGSRNLVRLSLTNSLKTSAAVNGGHAAPAVNQAAVTKYGYDRTMVYPRIGEREIVGFGLNGHPSYFDQPAHPMPAVRWAEDTPELAALRAKAKGDWASLTVDEKKKCKFNVNRNKLFNLQTFNVFYLLQYTELISVVQLLRLLLQMVSGSSLLVSFSELSEFPAGCTF